MKNWIKITTKCNEKKMWVWRRPEKGSARGWRKWNCCKLITSTGRKSPCFYPPYNQLIVVREIIKTTIRLPQNCQHNGPPSSSFGGSRQRGKKSEHKSPSKSTSNAKQNNSWKIERMRVGGGKWSNKCPLASHYNSHAWVGDDKRT